MYSLMWSRSQAPRSSAAAEEDAVSVAEPDQVGHPLRWVVPAHCVGAPEVEDWSDHHGGVGQPGLEQVNGQGAEAVNADGRGEGVEVGQR